MRTATYFLLLLSSLMLADVGLSGCVGNPTGSPACKAKRQLCSNSNRCCSKRCTHIDINGVGTCE